MEGKLEEQRPYWEQKNTEIREGREGGQKTNILRGMKREGCTYKTTTTKRCYFYKDKEKALREHESTLVGKN